jgi:hypothetical protein
MEEVAMKAWIIGGLSVLASLAAARGFAQDAAWRPAGSTPAFQRVQRPTDSPISLSRPVPASATEESHVVPATLLEAATPVFRAKTIEPQDLHLIMPVGPAPDTSKQPGTAKPMGGSFEKIQKMPRVSDSFSAPAPQVIYSSPGSMPLCPSAGITYLDGGTVTVSEGYVLEECPPCDISCGSYVSETCGPCWGRRLRDLCGVTCEDPCAPNRPNRWFRAEYLLWGISHQKLPPLLTTELAPIRGPDEAGVLPLSPILFGEDEAHDSVRSGGRIQFGFWFPRAGRWGMDVGAFILGRRNFHFDAASDAGGSPVLARPFIDANTGGESAQLVSYPGLLAGRFSYDSSTRLWGLDAHFRRKLQEGPRYWIDGFIGYRHLNLADTIDINENLRVIDPSQGTVGFLLNDHFATRNSFNGPQVGLEAELKLLRRWFVAGNVKLALGNVHQVVNIDGRTTFLTAGGAAEIGRGGLLALASNIGRHERDEFAVVTEFGIKLGFDLTEHLRMYAGYNVLFLSNSVRAGDQIDRTINFNQAPEPGNLNPGISAPARPAVFFRQSDFWAQGGQFGIEYHW